MRLQRQPAKMLAALVAQPGEIVDRAALQAAIWGSETIVDFEFPALAGPPKSA